MAEKIALTVDNENDLCTFAAAKYLKILDKTNGTWQCEKLLPLDLNAINTTELRTKIRNIIDSIPECKILLSADISGIPYYIFDKMGFAIFESPSETQEILNEIITETKNNQKELASETAIPCTPTEITDGCYFLDYVLLESKYPEMTTKKVLLPFLETKPFISLSVRLSHLPPWLEFGEYANKMEISTTKESEGVLVNIRHKLCGE